MASNLHILSRSSFEQLWSTKYSRVFSGRPVLGGAFVDADWKIIGLSVPAFVDAETGDAQTALALASSARECGSATLVGKNRTDFDQASAYALSAPMEPEMVGPMQIALLDPSEAHMFSESVEWGMVVEPTDGLYFLGGSPRFMNLFLSRSRGESVYRAWFVERLSMWGSELHVRSYASKLLTLLGW